MGQGLGCIALIRTLVFTYSDMETPTPTRGDRLPTPCLFTTPEDSSSQCLLPPLPRPNHPSGQPQVMQTPSYQELYRLSWSWWWVLALL